MTGTPTYAWKPHKTILQDGDSFEILFIQGADTVEDLKESISDYINHSVDNRMTYQINDVMYLGIYSGLRHTTNRDTWGLANDRIPQSNTLDQTVSFLIAFNHERELATPILQEYIESQIIQNAETSKYMISRIISLGEDINNWTNRADKIVELMDTARSKVGHLAADAEFMRNWALVELGETGLELTTADNPLQIGWIRHNTLRKEKMLSRCSTKLIQLRGLWQPPASREYRYYNNTDTATVTAKNGPSQIRVKTSPTAWSAWTVLAKDASRTFTKNEMRWDIESEPILIPTVEAVPANLSLNIGVTESVNLTSVFDGLNVVISATTSDSTKATVQVNRTQTSMGVIGVAAGTSTITVTGTNEAGAKSTTFVVTVTEPSSD